MYRPLHLLLLFMAMLCAGNAQAVTSVVAGTPYAQTSTSNSALPLVAPSATAVNDVLLAQIVASSGTTLSAPSGWTELTGVANINGLQQRVYYRLAATAGAVSYAFTVGSSSSLSMGVIVVVQGADTTKPICGTGMQSGSANPAIAPSVQTQSATCTAGGEQLAFFAINDGGINLSLALENGASAGPTQRVGSGASGWGMFSSYYNLSAASSSSQQSGTLSASTDWVGATVIVNPRAVVSDHIQLEITGTPLTCAPSTVIVKACTSAACSALLSSSTTVTLSSSNTASSWPGGNTVSFTGSSTRMLQLPTAGSTTLGASSVPTATNATQCYLNGVQVSNCQIPFVDSGLLLTIPPQSSGVTSSGSTTFSLAAVRNCVPAFANSTRNIGFWDTYTNPNTGTYTLSVGGTTVSMASPGTSVPLTFDATGTASGITLNYADAGQLTLNASYTGSPATGDAGLVMTGATAFAVVPYALCVDSPDSNWNCAADQTSAQTPTNCAVYKTAGANFNLRVTGKAYKANTATCSSPTTPNYQQSGIVLSPGIYAPLGGSTGSLSDSNGNKINVTSAGTAMQSEVMSEVGVFTLAAMPQSQAYFGQTVPSGSGNFGRFIPAGFTVSNSTLTNRADLTCSASTFTYLDEPLRSQFTLTAINSAGATTTNYTGNYARLTLVPVMALGANGLAFGAQSGTTLLNPNATALSSRLSATCNTCGPFSKGVALIDANVTVKRANGTTKDNPYNAAKIGLAVTDADGVVMSSPNYNWDLDAKSVLEGISLGQTNLYFGRLHLENRYGSPLINLPVPATAQYWNGSGFSLNTADSCTQLKVPATAAMSSNTASNPYCKDGVWLYGSLTGVTATMQGIAAGTKVTLNSGDAKLILSKPSNTGGGYLDLVLEVPDYLKYYYDNLDQKATDTCTIAPSTDAGYGYFNDDYPRARIRFGAKRNDGVIYIREIY